jgi:hypothetical protein
MPFGIWFSIFLLRGRVFFSIDPFFNLLSLFFYQLRETIFNPSMKGESNSSPFSFPSPCHASEEVNAPRRGGLASSGQATLEPLPGGQAGKLCGFCYVGRRAMSVGGQSELSYWHGEGKSHLNKKGEFIQSIAATLA